ncbi:GNAT family N-acetyltransferase [bacterium]|nr:MAG: GNAT family N-acetyltransferase [bacterium]
MCRLGTSASTGVEIIPFEPKYQQDFKNLNEAWITQWFKMEEADYKALDHPQEYILAKGGAIFMALLDGDPIGTCALIKMDEDTYEMAKMAVSEKAKGKGIGFLLGQAIIAQARNSGAKRIYLESNTLLKPAINLYRKLGFTEVQGYASPYERCDIQMELELR